MKWERRKPACPNCCRIVDLRCREVICVQDSTRLGYVNDVEIDITSGRIAALVVPGRGKGGLLGRREDFIIPWESVRGIGDEIILTSFCPQGGPPPAPWEENPPR